MKTGLRNLAAAWATLLCLELAHASEADPCKSALETNLKTEDGLTSTQYFGELRRKDPDGRPRPRYIQLVGAPGSGKTTWARAALAQDKNWKLISSDDIRQLILKRLKAQGKRLEIDGKSVEPDPIDPDHLFAPQVLDRGIRDMIKLRGGLFGAGHSVLDDKVNGTILRADDLVAARAAGYWTEALVFVSLDPKQNARNIEHRVRQGGIPIPRLGIDLNRRDLVFFSENLRPKPWEPSSPEKRVATLPALDWREARRLVESARPRESLYQAIERRPPALRDALKEWAKQDYFDEVHFVFVEYATEAGEQKDVSWLPLPNRVKWVAGLDAPIALLTTSAYAVIIQDGKVLLSRHRTRGWDLPGGHIEAGETPDVAAQREVFEETAAKIGALKLLGHQRIELLGAKPDGYRYPHPTSYQLFYTAKVESLGEFKVEEDSVERAWVPLEEARKQVKWIRENPEAFGQAIQQSGP